MVISKEFQQTIDCLSQEKSLYLKENEAFKSRVDELTEEKAAFCDKNREFLQENQELRGKVRRLEGEIHVLRESFSELAAKNSQTKKQMSRVRKETLRLFARKQRESNEKSRKVLENVLENVNSLRKTHILRLLELGDDVLRVNAGVSSEFSRELVEKARNQRTARKSAGNHGKKPRK